MRSLVALAGALLLTLTASEVLAQMRIKDITTVRGLRANQLVGYGLVTGLKRTGDSLRNAPFTALSMRSMLERMGVNTSGEPPRTRNVAAVMVTADLPPFAAGGQRIDVTISSLGDASSLSGGTLVLTPLYAPDRQIYAVAQGSVLVSGFEAKGANENLTVGVPTVGRIAGGAIVEKAAPGRLLNMRVLRLDLRNPDFATANAIVRAINAHFMRSGFDGYCPYRGTGYRGVAAVEENPHGGVHRNRRRFDCRRRYTCSRHRRREDRYHRDWRQCPG